jgi:hypothetical protein
LMENLGKTNGAEPLSVEVVSRVDEILSDFFGKLDNSIQSLVKRYGVDDAAPSNSELDDTLAELIERVENLEGNDPHEVAVGVVEENTEGFVREDDLPDHIISHCGVTLDPEEISELIKKTVVQILIHNVCFGIEPHADPHLVKALLDSTPSNLTEGTQS